MWRFVKIIWHSWLRKMLSMYFPSHIQQISRIFIACLPASKYLALSAERIACLQEVEFDEFSLLSVQVQCSLGAERAKQKLPSAH
jgi:hypothetical protein